MQELAPTPHGLTWYCSTSRSGPTPLGENAFKDNRKYVIHWQPKAYIELDLSEYGHA